MDSRFFKKTTTTANIFSALLYIFCYKLKCSECLTFFSFNFNPWQGFSPLKCHCSVVVITHKEQYVLHSFASSHYFTCYMMCALVPTVSICYMSCEQTGRVVWPAQTCSRSGRAPKAGICQYTKCVTILLYNTSPTPVWKTDISGAHLPVCRPRSVSYL